ncbi:MAG: AAA family ATPase [Clostridiales bacterium]|jgi:ATP-dependent Clp protease ATP-binding subunit ClpA|nr:AAA family ATPase [Clostridiales bacterium]
MKLDNLTSQVYVVAVNEARLHGHEYLMPEHFLYSSLMFDDGKNLIATGGGNIQNIIEDLNRFFVEQFHGKANESPMESYAFNQMVNLAGVNALNAGKSQLTLREFLIAILTLRESYAQYILAKNGVNKKVYLENEFIETKTRPSDETDPYLLKYTVDLVEAAKEKKLDPLVGREDILERTTHVLCRRLKNNPVHVGDPGVGKTAVVEGLAQRVASGKVPAQLKNVRIFRVDMGALVAGTRYRGDFEERLVKLLEAVSQLEKPILYIDEIHTVVGTGAVSGGSMDATSIIKPYLSSGEIRFIGSTTFEEYKKHFEKDRALARRFARIDITEPSEEECIKILQGLRSHYEKFHGVKYSDEILEQIVALSNKHMNDRFMPDKAIDTMDEAGVFTRLNAPDSLYEVTEAAVERVVARAAKVPEKSVAANETVALKSLYDDLCNRVYGQEEAVRIITHAIHSARAGLNEPDRPVANLLFVGPTGVGKTEVAKQLAELLGIKLSRFDMSEYQEKHAVARLIGSPPGYVGYEEGGLLTDAIRKNPHCVLLLDEIEKAHMDILNVMLQVMDYGSLTDNTGKKADFRNVIIIMTSNAGAREMTRQTIGFGGELDSAAAEKAVEKIFSPEFRNRLDAVVRFKPVDKEMASRIAQKSLDKLAVKLAAKNITFIVAKNALEHIASKGLSETYGAREIIRLVENNVKKLLVEEVLFGELKNGGACKLIFNKGELKVERGKKK